MGSFFDGRLSSSAYKGQRQTCDQLPHYPEDLGPRARVLIQYKSTSPRNDPDYLLEEWYHNGRLVLDNNDRPLIRFLDILDVLSSAFPTYVIEAILRTDSRIHLLDMLARMPPAILRKAGTEGVVKGGTASQRTHRFRREAGCLERDGSKTEKTFLEEHQLPALKAANTTLGFRDLTEAESNGLKRKEKPLPLFPLQLLPLLLVWRVVTRSKRLLEKQTPKEQSTSTMRLDVCLLLLIFGRILKTNRPRTFIVPEVPMAHIWLNGPTSSHRPSCFSLIYSKGFPNLSYWRSWYI